jgi:integrase
MSKLKKFPMKVRCGSSSVTIYRQQEKRGYYSYAVRFYRGTEEVRITRSNFEDAHREAQAAARSLAHGELDVLTLRSDDRLSYVRAVQAVESTGVSLEKAAADYAEAHRMLGGAPLMEAVRFYVQRRIALVPSKSVNEVVEELIQHKREKGRCETYLKDMRLRLERFAGAFHCPISSVSTAQVEQFLLNLGVTGRTQNNFRRMIGTLFHFAVKRGYLPKDHSGVEDVELATETPPDIGIFTPEEMGKLLGAARPEIVPFVALGGFAGLRHAEVLRLDWGQVNFGSGHIEVTAKNSKTKVRRLVPMHENLQRWLLPHRRESGPVAMFENMTKQLLWLARDSQIAWRHNALRHSFVSYRVAEIQNVAQVAHEAGNSPRIIERNYLKRVVPPEATRWFGIMPPSKLATFPLVQVGTTN